MSDKKTKPSQSKPANPMEQVPLAEIETRAADSMLGRLWLLPVAALVLAFGLVWWSLPKSGVAIKIHFPEGHGLQTEDVVRFRGIDVGVVEEVKLNTELSGVDVQVMLKPFARKLAREGTRFWIVRPELSLTEISGLETAVGHKYIGLLPGDEASEARYRFEGLSEEPPDADADDGFEIIIRGGERYSINPGSPVKCRGVEVGKVLSVGLSQNARFVDVRARIYEAYRGFLNSETRFWASSGVDFDFSLGGGVKLKAESLETIAKGGVSMLTISDRGTPVSSGQVFKLYPEPEDDWFEKADGVRLNNVRLGYSVPLEVRWKQKGLFGTKSKQTRSFSGVAIKTDGKPEFWIPADVLKVPDKALPNTFNFGIKSKSQALINTEGLKPILAAVTEDSKIVKIPLDAVEMEKLELDWAQTPELFRELDGLEDCLAVRATLGAGKPEFFEYEIDKDLLFRDANTNEMTLRSFDGDESIWHGAPVLSVRDGCIVGVLLTDEKKTLIVPIQ